MLSMLDVIKTPISFAGWLATSLTFTLLCIPLTYLPAPQRYENRLYFFLTTIWGKLLMAFSFLFVKVHGKENLPDYPHSPAIIIMNHTSSLDIFFIESLMKSYPHIWLVKNEYTKIPLFSILIKRMHVAVQRDDARQAGRALLKAYKQARATTSHLVMFPEGRRHHDGVVHPFNAGFAILAKKLNRPVIPIAVSGFEKIMSKGTIFLDYHVTQPTAIIGKPITIGKNESADEFCTRVQKWFKQSTL